MFYPVYVKLRIHSITLCDITIQIVTHRVDWFSCLAFVLLQYTPARPPNLIFRITCRRPQISLSKAACERTAAGCAPLVYAYIPFYRYASCVGTNKGHCESQVRSQSQTRTEESKVEFLGYDMNKSSAEAGLYSLFSLSLLFAICDITLVGLLVKKLK